MSFQWRQCPVIQAVTKGVHTRNSVLFRSEHLPGIAPPVLIFHGFGHKTPPIFKIVSNTFLNAIRF